MCQATGDPQPKIVWNKKGKKVSSQRFEVGYDSETAGFLDAGPDICSPKLYFLVWICRLFFHV